MDMDKYGDFTDVKNKNNYSLGLSLNKYFGLSKIEIGFSFATKNYKFSYQDIYSDIGKENVKLNYILLPILYNHRLFSDSINTIL